MSRKRFQLDNPGKIGISINPDIAMLLRKHSAMNLLSISPIVEELIINYLKEEGYGEKIEEILIIQKEAEEAKKEERRLARQERER